MTTFHDLNKASCRHLLTSHGVHLCPHGFPVTHPFMLIPKLLSRTIDLWAWLPHQYVHSVLVPMACASALTDFFTSFRWDVNMFGVLFYLFLVIGVNERRYLVYVPNLRELRWQSLFQILLMVTLLWICDICYDKYKKIDAAISKTY